ncbi:AcrR family transcriptional regulator [Kibdelosporangium banguiense]|uniref:AcrR family transcriptional regulator n=1 Tax=Kibdelosporangium banguiense TaxID=1365924 RepID=A0ABS4TP32_9PSEU|nr:TetR/AcrR family transcriptional regulator [Kibdelosporangium banguiense]MBP2326173.1 AcrR family transcriptional regulator [Kibdelosporangium banguiense]
MTGSSQRPLRVDAARNAELIVRTAWRVFSELGTEVPLDEVAKQAGVGVATLYRRFPSKDDLLFAILQWRYAEQIEPAINSALVDEDPWRALVTAISASLDVASAEHAVIKALRDRKSLLHGLMDRYFADLGAILQRAQQAGLVRADLRGNDLPMVFYMIIGSMRVAEPASGWRRCLGVLLDGMRPAAATPLPGD